MLAPLLVTEDPYAAASVFSQAGWKFEYETARGGDRPRACVSLALARVVLVTATSRPVDALPRGLGVELQLHVPPHELSGLFLLHRATGVAVSDLRRVPSGERGFSAEIVGYRFLIVGGEPDPDMALITTDPRIAALADGLRQRDGAGEPDRQRAAPGRGLGRERAAAAPGAGQRTGRQGSTEVGDQLAEVMIAAAILARQLGRRPRPGSRGAAGQPAWRGRR